MVGIINYGMGNIVSIQNALDFLCTKSSQVISPKDLFKFSRLILPGVGSFQVASQILHGTGFADEIRKFSESRPVLGICLGMQLLATRGFEGGESSGLDLVPGKVVPFDMQFSELVPFVGFQNVERINSRSLILKEIDPVEPFYFTHKFKFVPELEGDISSFAYNGQRFCSSVECKNVFGVQFHPELSQRQGIQVLKNFINL